MVQVFVFKDNDKHNGQYKRCKCLCSLTMKDTKVSEMESFVFSDNDKHNAQCKRCVCVQ